MVIQHIPHLNDMT